MRQGARSIEFDAEPEALTVSELTAYIKGILEDTLPSVWVTGEISNLSRPRSGHVYFTLKDDGAQIRAVMWKTTASKLRFDLAEGQHVVAFGGIEVYPPQGSYQIVLRQVEPLGIGALQLAFQQLQQKLQAEGLFDPRRKKPIPAVPTRIGVVTSPTGAAVQDFLEIALRRNPKLQAVIIPAMVQGPGAAASIMQAIRQAERIEPRLDVLVVTRGGGSLEDLWCFNEEPVVRAIAGCSLPTVSGVGHEIDVTLADLAADLRALTPSDAALRVVPDVAVLVEMLQGQAQRLRRSLDQKLQAYRERLEQLAGRPVLRRPHDFLMPLSRSVDELDRRASLAIQGVLERQKLKLGHCAAQLEALSPLAILSRGYGVTVSQSDQQVIKSIKQLTPGQKLKTHLTDGTFESVVKNMEG